MTELRYDGVSVGDAIGPEEYDVTETVAREYHESIEADHPHLVGDGTDLVDATILGELAMSTVTAQYPGGGLIYAKGDLEFASPVEVGDTVIAEGTIAEKYEKRGRKYVVVEVGLRSDDGTGLGRVAITYVVEAHR